MLLENRVSGGLPVVVFSLSKIWCNKKINKKVNKQNIRNTENWFFDDLSKIQVKWYQFIQNKVESALVKKFLYHSTV